MYNAPTVYCEIQKEHRKHSVVKKSGVTTSSMHKLFTSCMEVPNACRLLQSPTRTYLKRKSLPMPNLYPATPKNK